MKKLYILIVFILLAACSSKSERDFLPDRFKIIMSKYFEGYEYSYKDVSVRGNKNYGDQLGRFEIKKTHLSQNEMGEIYKKLKLDGWIINESKNNYIDFCNGENLSLGILYPLNASETTSSGEPIGFEKMNVWNIYIYKSTTKIPRCNKSPDIIDFTKL